jgi:hypothetical protein
VVVVFGREETALAALVDEVPRRAVCFARGAAFVDGFVVGLVGAGFLVVGFLVVGFLVVGFLAAGVGLAFFGAGPAGAI